MSTPARPLLLGHRGAPRERLENTLASFARALSLGADGVELDVQRSSDGVPVVIHDPTLLRTFGLRQRVADLPWPALEQLTGARLPSLEQATAWAAASRAWINIELKTTQVEERVLELVGSHGIGERVVISSFDAESVRRVGALDSAIRRYLLTERWDDHVRREVDRVGAGGVCLRLDAADDRTLALLRDGGLPVIVWTVNLPDEVRRLARGQVAAIISDLPALAASLDGG